VSAECKHLLNPDWCADCNGKAAQEKADEAAERERVLALGDWFPARYAGVCRSCGAFFVVETPITPEPGGGYRAACCAPAGDPA
jgi:hypothetical protein